MGFCLAEADAREGRGRENRAHGHPWLKLNWMPTSRTSQQGDAAARLATKLSSDTRKKLWFFILSPHSDNSQSVIPLCVSRETTAPGVVAQAYNPALE